MYCLKFFNLLSINSCLPENHLFHISKPYPFDIHDLKRACRGISQVHSAHVGAGVWFYLKILCLLFRMNFNGKKDQSSSHCCLLVYQRVFSSIIQDERECGERLDAFSSFPMTCHSLALLPFSLTRQVFGVTGKRVDIIIDMGGFSYVRLESEGQGCKFKFVRLLLAGGACKCVNNSRCVNVICISIEQLVGFGWCKRMVPTMSVPFKVYSMFGGHPTFAQGRQWLQWGGP